MDSFQKILDDISGSTKTIRVLPSDNAVKKKIVDKYEINPESLLGMLLENTGNISYFAPDCLEFEDIYNYHKIYCKRGQSFV